ncbi:DUF1415 domain-containing protein [Pseudomonas sp.]|uniref:DUF1415 domain-containing protein n=1 Tax=Pseudomonas sp. TaxID=306 RepID=UPI002B61E3F4|nr:DUF1415 domain-containing protein [Pseudomonas sp.]HUE94526.1 DUF1415 domain-containing protein [Pseudomonas sp.]
MSSTATPSAAHAIAETRAWVERAVIGLNLCPFAKAVQVKGQVRYVFCASAEPAELLATLIDELHHLANCPAQETDTTLLIHPAVLGDFLDFNDFLAVVDDTLDDLGYSGILQVASFHPQFQFADTHAADMGNATNRSPYPTLHLLREASIDRAVAAFPDPEAIFEANIETLEALGADGWAALQAQCREDAKDS